MSRPVAPPRSSRLIHALMALLMACGVWAPQASVAATADPVWRCPTTNGSTVSYQSTPCRDGGHALPAGKPPTPEDREASARVAEREADLARNMSRQRARRESDLSPAHSSLSGPVRQVSVGQTEKYKVNARGRTRKRSADETAPRARPRRRDVFRAEVPGHSRQRSGAHQADAASASPP